ncbi:MAG: aldolase/citrate lyase family protein [Verrucomicrobia bacterium]|nr:aldolase/citrate lyase family protein [Verrucomicrobiota bacterium]
MQAKTDNPVRRKLERGELVLGMMHFTGNPMIVEVMASAGLDFFVIDMEHSPIDLSLAVHLIRTAEAAGIAPLVRVPEVDPGLIKKLLNMGVQGIVIPHATRETCAAVVQAVRFSPDGTRGSCQSVRQAGYGQSDWKAFTEEANRQILIIPLLEDKESIDDFEALVAMPGLDVFFLGAFDFAVSAGIPGAGFDHPVLMAALERMVKHAQAHGKYVMTSFSDNISTEKARDIISRGVQMVSYGVDALVFRRACLDIARLKLAEDDLAAT